MLAAAALEPLMRDLVARDKVKIPPYPAVALKLQQTIDAGQYGLSELAQITAADQVLAATVLRIANSAYFRRSANVTSLGEAISRLGAEELCRVALAASLGGVASQNGALGEIRRTAWRQSLAAALCTQSLARARGLHPQSAFMCGLLHDFGRVVAVACLEEILTSFPGQETLTFAEWKGLVDAFHVELGLLVAARWNLPGLLLTVISSHHQPELSGQYRDMVDAVMLGDRVVELLEDCPYLLRRDLTGRPGFEGPQDVDALMEVLPFIPGYISSFDEITGAVGNPAKSRVTKSETQIEEEKTPIEVPVAWVRSNGETPYRTEFVSERAIGIVGKTPIFEGAVARLRIDPPAPEKKLELSGRVVLCRQETAGYFMEVRLFALPGPAQTAWPELYARLCAPAPE